MTEERRHPCRSLGEQRHIANGNLCPTRLVGFEAKQLVDGFVVAEDKARVVFIEVCGINRDYAEAARTKILVEEIGEHLVADSEVELLGKLLGYDNSAGGFCGREGGVDASLDELAAQEGEVVALVDAAEQDALETVVGLQHARLAAIALDMGNLGQGGDGAHDSVGYDDGLCLAGVERLVVEDGDVASDAYNFILHLALEPKDDGNGNYHDGQAQCNAGGGDEDGRA